jgi:multidrug efflux pump subunit AcrA (membrane-fusion protein)
MVREGLFRERALAALSAPDGLEERVRVVLPRTWVALFGLLVVVVAVVLWSSLTLMQDDLTGVGFVTPAQGWASIQTPVSGIVEALVVQVGDPVVVGEALALVGEGADSTTIRSPVTGTVEQVSVSSQEYLSAGTQMAVIRPASEALVVHAYVPAASAHSVVVGQSVDMSLGPQTTSKYGFLLGRVSSVAPFPATSQRLIDVLQNPSLVRQVQALGPVTEIGVALIPDRSSPNGYKWSLGKGPSYQLTGGLPVDVSIVVGERHPISYIF